MERLPPHKTLFRALPGKGLPIGNLNSQFFANVYLNALDQFVKHALKCRWYLRYCDDFVLLARSRDELLAWRERIRAFLAEQLLLELNDRRERLRPVADGVDFLGYIVRPFHLLVRRRVVGHLRERLTRFERALVARGGRRIEMQGLRRPRPTARGAVAGFPVGQLPRRLAARLADGRAVAWLAEQGAVGPCAPVQRRLVRRWVPKTAHAGPTIRGCASSALRPPWPSPPRSPPPTTTCSRCRRTSSARSSAGG